MEIREARPDDVDGIERVAADAWHEAHAPIAGEAAVEEFLGEYYTAHRLREAVADQESPLLVAVDADANVVGFTQVVPTADEDDIFSLTRIYVDPNRWGNGIGSRLLERVKRAAADRGATRLRLGVMAENDRAVEFYEYRGFERVDADYDDRLGVDRYIYATEL
jgi:ribosomal protein S18 acetylase RimI-like enzyme